MTPALVKARAARLHSMPACPLAHAPTLPPCGPLPPPHPPHQAAGRFVAGRKPEYLAYCRTMRAPEPPEGLEVDAWEPEVGFWRDTHGAWHLVRQDILRLANDAVYTAPQLPPAALAAAADAGALADLGEKVLAPLRAAAAAAGAPPGSDPFADREAGLAFTDVLQRALGVLKPDAIERGWPLAPWEADLLPRGAEELRRHYAPGSLPPLPPPDAAGGVAAPAETTAEAPWEAPPGGALAPADPRDRGAAARAAAALAANSLDPPIFVWQSLPTDEGPLQPMPPPPPLPADPEAGGGWAPAPRALRGWAARRDARGSGALADLRRAAAAGQLPWGVTVERAEDGLLLPLTQVGGWRPGLAARTGLRASGVWPAPS
jgi:hypothetical protein